MRLSLTLRYDVQIWDKNEHHLFLLLNRKSSPFLFLMRNFFCYSMSGFASGDFDPGLQPQLRYNDVTFVTFGFKKNFRRSHSHVRLSQIHSTLSLSLYVCVCVCVNWKEFVNVFLYVWIEKKCVCVGRSEREKWKKFCTRLEYFVMTVSVYFARE